MIEGKIGGEPDLAEFLLGLLANLEAEPPRIRNREDYFAAETLWNCG